MRPPAGRLPREARLTDKIQFDRVHREGLRVSDGLFAVIARPNDLGHARLGMAVGIKAAVNSLSQSVVIDTGGQGNAPMLWSGGMAWIADFPDPSGFYWPSRSFRPWTWS